eukprot:Partr_v1_DN26795_c0_g1_i2_m8449 putative DEAH (Asp-Glu-Ala-His) box polypeptide
MQFKKPQTSKLIKFDNDGNEQQQNAPSKERIGSDAFKKSMLLKNARMQLPIASEKSRILKEVALNRIIVLVGETGSGKTTQIPQFLFDAGYARRGMIACTQPRRVAAISLARRVAEEFGTELGDAVGYTIRFEDKTSSSTKIKYMTDGMLLREILNDSLLSRYSVILLDEAHERTLRTDILFGMVKLILIKRKDLKVIVMSATLEARKFSSYFGDCPILYIEGRQHPVKLLCTNEPQQDYMDSSLITIFQIHQQEESGDILVFLTGQDEIESLEKLLNDNSRYLPPQCPKLLVCPLFANLPTHQQAEIFNPTPPGHRKCVLATNIAETSITISGIKYVVDSGLRKVRGFDARTGMETLNILPISKASARQRAGRAGRQSAGKCFRLYTEETFKSLEESDIPEIQRCHLSSVALLLMAAKVSDVLSFDFMDRPSRDSLSAALEELLTLGAIDNNQSLTPLGKQMAEFPLDPPYSKALIMSKELECVQETIAVIALLSVENIFYTPNDKRDEATEMRKKFTSQDGDLITYLNVLESYLLTGKDKKWCGEHFINSRALAHVIDVQNQLTRHVEKLGFQLTLSEQTSSRAERILHVFLSAFSSKLALRQVDGSYKTVSSRHIVHIHPSSVLFSSKPELVMYCDIICTSKRYMRS